MKPQRWSRQEILSYLDSCGFDWQNPLDVFPVKYRMVLLCRACGTTFKRYLHNMLNRDMRDCPACIGKRCQGMSLDSLRKMFCRRRLDGDEYLMSGLYILRNRRRLYKFKHLKCDQEFWGTKEFFYGETGCPVCYRQGGADQVL